MSFGFSDKSSKQQQSSQTQPWEPAIPYLKDILGKAGAYGQSVGPTATQNTAFESLKQTAGAEMPWLSEINKLAGDQFALGSKSGMAGDAYETLKTQLGGIASGANLDFSTNPYIQKVLQQAGDDAAKRSNAMFIGAGRDPVNNVGGQAAMAKAVTNAQSPLLLDLYKDQQSKMIDAAKTLYGAGTGTATTMQGLDTNALAARSGGIDTATALRNAELRPQTDVLNLEQQRKMLPFEDLSLYAQLIAPIAGLGQQSQGQGTGRQTGYTLGASLT